MPEPSNWVLVKGPRPLGGPFGGASFRIEDESAIVVEPDGTLRISHTTRSGQPRITVFAAGAWNSYSTGSINDFRLIEKENSNA